MIAQNLMHPDMALADKAADNIRLMGTQKFVLLWRLADADARRRPTAIKKMTKASNFALIADSAI